MFGARQWICHAACASSGALMTAQGSVTRTQAQTGMQTKAAGPSERSDAAERDDSMMMVRRQPKQSI
jgi:hypothetical protein